MKTKPEYSGRKLKTLREAKQAERAGGVRIFTDALLRVTVVVELGGEWWLVPKSANGWARRQRLNMTPAAQTERLRPARGISPAWLGIDGRNRRKTGPRMHGRQTP